MFFDLHKLYRQGMYAFKFFLKSNVSFTRDVNVAYQFRGTEGIILGMNTKQCLEDDMFGPAFRDSIAVCDVSLHAQTSNFITKITLSCS